MPDRSFVESLELATFNRPTNMRAEREFVSNPQIRRGEARGAAPVIGDRLRAAVNAGALVSFVAGLSAAEMTDVLFSIQLAQRAASAKHDRFAATKEWYTLYGDVLGRLGWIGEAFAFTERAKTAGSFTIDKSALDVIMTVATGNQLAILVKTLQTLKSLADKSGAVRLFEWQALSEFSGNFQIGAAQRAENGALSLAIGAFYFHASDSRGRALFVAWGAEEIGFWAGAQKMTLNSALYAKHRAAVAARLAAEASDYIAELEIV